MLNTIAWWLLIIGGLNWGLAIFNVNLVESIFGGVPALMTLVYALVGLAAVWTLFNKLSGKKM